MKNPADTLTPPAPPAENAVGAPGADNDPGRNLGQNPVRNPGRGTPDVSEDEAVRLAASMVRCGEGEAGSRAAQDLLAATLGPRGFEVLHAETAGVRHLLLLGPGTGPFFLFAGHTDVVPTGPEAAWRHRPFSGVVEEGVLYGRGSADMRSGLAAAAVAVRRRRPAVTARGRRIGFLVAGDEETTGSGAPCLLDLLLGAGHVVDGCVMAEPTAESFSGDVIKTGRRGSMTATVTVRGVQGHSAYPDRAVNALHAAAKAVGRLAETAWDGGDERWVPTTLQVTNFTAGSGASNVVPGTASFTLNVRHSPLTPGDTVALRCADAIASALAGSSAEVDVTWEPRSDPFSTPRGPLVEAVERAVWDVRGVRPRDACDGGTSDARFFAARGIDVVELGVPNATIHQIDERVGAEDVATLCFVFERVTEYF